MKYKKKKFDINKVNSEVRIAMNFVVSWFKQQHTNHSIEDLDVEWFAFTSTGWKCMIFSKKYPNMFFEIAYTNQNQEIRCNFFQRFEYIARIEDQPSVFKKVNLGTQFNSLI